MINQSKNVKTLSTSPVNCEQGLDYFTTPSLDPSSYGDGTQKKDYFTTPSSVSGPNPDYFPPQNSLNAQIMDFFTAQDDEDILLNLLEEPIHTDVHQVPDKVGSETSMYAGNVSFKNTRQGSQELNQPADGSYRPMTVIRRVGVSASQMVSLSVLVLGTHALPYFHSYGWSFLYSTLPCVYRIFLDFLFFCHSRIRFYSLSYHFTF